MAQKSKAIINKGQREYSSKKKEKHILHEQLISGSSVHGWIKAESKEKGRLLVFTQKKVQL